MHNRQTTQFCESSALRVPRLEVHSAGGGDTLQCVTGTQQLLDNERESGKKDYIQN